MCEFQQSSVVDALLDVTKDKPWLWAVLLLVVVLPTVLLIAYCCITRGSKVRLNVNIVILTVLNMEHDL